MTKRTREHNGTEDNSLELITEEKVIEQTEQHRAHQSSQNRNKIQQQKLHKKTPNTKQKQNLRLNLLIMSPY